MHLFLVNANFLDSRIIGDGRKKSQLIYCHYGFFSGFYHVYTTCQSVVLIVSVLVSERKIKGLIIETVVIFFSNFEYCTLDFTKLMLNDTNIGKAGIDSFRVFFFSYVTRTYPAISFKNRSII